MTSRSLITKFGGTIALLGGFLMVESGFAAHGFLLSILVFINGNVNHYLSGFVGEITIFTVQVLTTLITLGGVTVILGGIFILFRRIFTGRLLITIGGGAGFFGLAIALAYSAMILGLSSLLTHSEYWAGVVLAAIARSLAKPK